MLHLDTILSYYTPTRSRCRVRLYRNQDRVLALLSEVPGNLGTPLAVARSVVVSSLLARFPLSLESLVIVEGVEADWGEPPHFVRLTAQPQAGVPTGQTLTLEEMAQLTGGEPPSSLPFWREQTSGALVARVGPWRAVVFPVGSGPRTAWQAHLQRADGLQRPLWSRTLPRPVRALELARCWALDAISLLSSELDMWE